MKRDHPIVDSDGHLIECFALVRDHIVALAGTSMGEEFDRILGAGRAMLVIPAGMERRAQGRYRTAWWGIPTRSTLDRALDGTVIEGEARRELKSILVAP